MDEAIEEMVNRDVWERKLKEAEIAKRKKKLRSLAEIPEWYRKSA